VAALKNGSPTVDFVLGNTKARMRMVAQYTIAGARAGW
jgi:NAD+ synthase